MMKQKAIWWILAFSVLVIGALAFTAYWTVYVDPFFHYHAPKTDEFYYLLNNQRSQNDGIIKHFEYEGMIAGTSLTENFRTSEAEEMWGCSFVKIPTSGGSYKEVNDNISTALKNNQNVRVVIRGLDLLYCADDKDRMRNELGDYPTYLLDNDPFNDVHYLFNRDVIFSRVYPMVCDSRKEGFQGGITSFDAYSNWMGGPYRFGKNSLYPNGIPRKEAGIPVKMTDEEKERILGNVHQNITDLAKKYPNVTFYYFFTPLSAQWWQDLLEQGLIEKQIETERIVIREILTCKNIRLYSFNNLTDITTDLNNYKDPYHYGEWINRVMLRYMRDGKYLLIEENYEDYLAEELKFYTTFDYTSMNDQEDYENDRDAEEVWEEVIYDYY